MKAICIAKTIIICAVIFISACRGEKERQEEPQSPRIKKFSKISQPKSNQSLTLGESIAFSISSDEKIDSVQVEYENDSRMFYKKEFDWKPSTPRTGKQKVRLTVFSAEQNETHYARVTFLSDITPATYAYQVLGEYNHNDELFTQGLFFIGDTLVESTGQEGTSKLTKYDMQTGRVYQSVSLSNDYFGEGSTYWNDNIYYLTWKAQKGFIYNLKLERTGQFNYAHEGWGMTTMGDTLVVSDGTELLHLLDPRDLTEIGTLQVYDNKRAVGSLNELEYIKGVLYANIWQEDIIIGIDPKTGKELFEIDLENLRSSFQSNVAEVLNGIAYKQNTDQTIVTGKNWPKMFEVKFAPIN